MNYLFIITYGRTGSTALQMALNALPGYCIRGENGGALAGIAQSLEAIRSAKSHPSRVQTSPSHPWYGLERIDIDTLTEQLNQAFVEQVLRPPEGTRVLGFKEIRYDRITKDEFDVLLSHMRSSFSPRFIFLTRDPMQAARSGMWSGKKKVRQHLRRAHDRLVAASGEPDSFLLDHSSFAHSPEGIVPLLEWLGEDPRPAVDSLKNRLSHLQDRNELSIGQKLRRRLLGLLGRST